MQFPFIVIWKTKFCFINYIDIRPQPKDKPFSVATNVGNNFLLAFILNWKTRFDHLGR